MTDSLPLAALLSATLDGDWGIDAPSDRHIPFRVIRGTDFASVRSGDTSSVPLRYIREQSAERRRLKALDIVIETAGGGREKPTGRTLLLREHLLDSFDLPTTCASFSRFLRVDPSKADPEYVYWYLQYLYEDGAMWEYQVQHTGVARFQYTLFARSTLVPLPPRAYQTAVAQILGRLDEKMILNRQMNRTLEGMARAIFKSWFVDFDPVTAKTAGRRPFGMDGESALLFPTGFEGSSNGPVPQGWRVSAIGDEVKVVGGSTPRTDEPKYWDGGTIHWATPRDLSTLADPVLLDTERRITAEGLAQISSGLLPSGTVLLSSRAPIGYLAVSEVPTAVNQGFIAMVCTGCLPNHYVLQWAREAMDEITSRAGGTTFAEISRASFRPIPVLVPDEGVLRAYEALVGPLHERVVENVRESRSLAVVRDTLLPKLLSLEVRVREAEKLVEQAGA